MHHATFRLGDDFVFQNTSWLFEANQQWAVVGPTGSGKSLFGEAICGQLPLVAGELIYSFRLPSPSKAPSAGRRTPLAPEDLIGHVSFAARQQQLHGTVLQSRWNSIDQEASLSVSDYLSYDRIFEVNPYEVRDHDSLQREQFMRRLRRTVNLLGLNGFINKKLLFLSNGERQKVELARALCRPLRLLVLDEPFTGLDEQARVAFRNVLEMLMANRLRVLLITTRAEDLPGGITHVLEVSNCVVKGAGSLSRWLRSRKKRWSPARRTQRLQLPQASSTLHRPLARTRGGLAVAIVGFRNVTVAYGVNVLLNNLSWSVLPGEKWALLGPNGSGKSTVLSLITGDNPQAFANDIVVFGRRLCPGHSIWDLKKHIGFVSPELHLHFDPAVSCLSVVASGFAGTIGLFETPSRARLGTARKALKEFGLAQMEDIPLFALSTGLQRMVLLARALVNNQRLLLLDEPCQGLDLEHRTLFLTKLETVLRRGTTAVVYVTHRADELPRGIEKVLRLEKPGS